MKNMLRNDKNCSFDVAVEGIRVLYINSSFTSLSFFIDVI